VAGDETRATSGSREQGMDQMYVASNMTRPRRQQAASISIKYTWHARQVCAASVKTTDTKTERDDGCAPGTRTRRRAIEEATGKLRNAKNGPACIGDDKGPLLLP